VSAHFLLSRRWVIRHVLALVVVSTCIGLALWQVQRLEDRRAANARAATQTALPSVPLESLLGSSENPDDAAYRRVAVRGSYDPDQEVVLRSRSFKNRAGNHLLTPLRTGAETAIVVDRGWVPLEIDEPGAGQALPPRGQVELTGILLPTEGRSAFGLADPPPGKADSVARVDLERLGQQLPYPIAPLYLRLTGQEPRGGALPEAVPLERAGEGPHFDYAVQWSFFALASLVVYLALIRKEARNLGRQSQEATGAAATG
jgi:cytochrome oxidase assembly protein ShyY1